MIPRSNQFGTRNMAKLWPTLTLGHMIPRTKLLAMRNHSGVSCDSAFQTVWYAEYGMIVA